MAIKKVFVIGAGTMGNGIAQVSAQAGYDVMMSDIKDEFVKKGMAAIDSSLEPLGEKGHDAGERKSRHHGPHQDHRG